MRSNNTTLRTTCELREFKARKTQATFFNQKPPTTPPPKTLRCTPHPSTHANPELSGFLRYNGAQHSAKKTDRLEREDKKLLDDT